MNVNLQRPNGAHAQSAQALDRWEDEGGAPVTAFAAADASAFSTAERELLQRLGAAVVSAWSDLPMPLQRALFRLAVAGQERPDPQALKAQMARFLHDCQGDTAPR